MPHPQCQHSWEPQLGAGERWGFPRKGRASQRWLHMGNTWETISTLTSMTQPSLYPSCRDLGCGRDIRSTKTLQVILMYSRAENHWVRQLWGGSRSRWQASAGGGHPRVPAEHDCERLPGGRGRRGEGMGVGGGWSG